MKEFNEFGPGPSYTLNADGTVEMKGDIPSVSGTGTWEVTDRYLPCTWA